MALRHLSSKGNDRDIKHSPLAFQIQADSSPSSIFSALLFLSEKEKEILEKLSGPHQSTGGQISVCSPCI